MKSYDDLQRFKEKTQTNHINFKEMSEQLLTPDSTNWYIIKQLLNDGSGSVLDNSQRIDLAAPQPIDPSTFVLPPVASVPTQPVLPFVTAAAADNSGSVLVDDISPSSKAPVPAHSLVPVAAMPTPAAPFHTTVLPQLASSARRSLFEQLATEPPVRPAVQQAQSFQPAQPGPVTDERAPLLQQQTAAVTADISYKQLFSSTAEPATHAVSKESLLQPLLEKISSCR